MNTTLVIMAAGIGSRFKEGLKQLEPVGPSGEVLMEYAIYDAISVGFNRIIFVIRKEIEADFRKQIGSKLSDKVKVDYAYQELSDLPDGYCLTIDRTKPWGTGQAILSTRHLINEPFAVINADDYYGKEGFEKIHHFLINKASKTSFCMAGFILGNTLSDNGTVTRGVCEVDKENKLIKITETSGISKTSNGVTAISDNAPPVFLDKSCYVSMNMWGFAADFILELEHNFKTFLSENINNPKAEYLLPTVVDSMIQAEKVTVSLLPTSERWYGMTYKADTNTVKAAIKTMIENGKYPKKLF